MQAIDTHAHLDFPEFESDRASILQQLAAEQIGVINVATDLASIEKVDQLSRENQLVWGAIGLHPNDLNDSTLLQLPSLLEGWQTLFEQNKKLVAIGEIGLDYFRARENQAAMKIQKAVLRQFLSFAQTINRPVIFHCREAYGDLQVMVSNYPGLRGVVHCFSGSIEQAQAFIDQGLLISFTANITYPKNEELGQVAKALPLEKIVLETDCPFLSPQTRRGERNDPTSVLIIAEEIGRLRGIDKAEVLAQTTNNAQRLFGLS